jgi:hypothetical protein
MPSKLQSILLGAVVYAIVSVVLAVLGQAMTLGTAGGAILLLFSCLFGLALGALPVWHYTSTHQLTIPAGTGAGMGAGALAIGVIIAAILQFALVAAGVMTDPQELMMDQWEAQGMTPEQIETAQAFSNPLISTAIGLVIGAIIGAVGGAIGAAMFKRGPEEPRV